MIDLATLGAGLRAPVLDSEQVFRGALEAMSRPGRVIAVKPVIDTQPKALHAAAASLALALLDQDTPLWLSPQLEPAAAYLRFHTGCPLAPERNEAQFALLNALELERLDRFRCGTDEYPDRSATLIVQVPYLEEGTGVALSGPGIRGQARASIGGLEERFFLQWARNHALFPRGVDLFFSCGEQLMALPRTTKVEA